MDKLEELASLIENRPFSIIADTNTFVWARAEHPAVFSEIKEIGGGNFLIVLGLFAVIGYLAKINAILALNKTNTIVSNIIKICIDINRIKQQGNYKCFLRHLIVKFLSTLKHKVRKI